MLVYDKSTPMYTDKNTPTQIDILTNLYLISITLMFPLMHRKVLKKNGEKEMQHHMYSYTTGCTNIIGTRTKLSLDTH